MALCSVGVSLKGTNSSGRPSRLTGSGDDALGCILELVAQTCAFDGVPWVSTAPAPTCRGLQDTTAGGAGMRLKVWMSTGGTRSMWLERSWENMEPAGTPDVQQGGLSAKIDAKDGSKILNRTFLHFYRYVVQVSRLSRAANRGWNPSKQHCGVECSPGTSICCRGWSALLTWLGDTAGDIRSRGTALMYLEGQPMALRRAEPACPGRPPAEPWVQAWRPEGSQLGKLVGQATANWELLVVSYSTSAGGVPASRGGSPPHGNRTQPSPGVNVHP